LHERGRLLLGHVQGLIVLICVTDILFEAGVDVLYSALPRRASHILADAALVWSLRTAQGVCRDHIWAVLAQLDIVVADVKLLFLLLLCLNLLLNVSCHVFESLGLHSWIDVSLLSSWKPFLVEFHEADNLLDVVKLI
jgi:hypothetical protein